ncbi:MAG TPA: hypothetical protein VEJ20_04270 [Candidatus Eremiobacteraceae bacterium]|nr:hypothetical protein [Candidatus Eremiobacteraceae bacterium]
MSWEAVTALSAAVTCLVIVVTVFVGVYQLREFQVQRRDIATIEVVRSLQDTTFNHAFYVIIALEPGIASTDLRARADAVEAAQILAFRFEPLGLMVHRGTIAFEVVDDLIGAAVMGAWERLKDDTERVRVEKHWPSYCEWFQWLAEQLEKRGRLQKAPAYLRFRDWNPSTGTRSGS